MGVSYSTYRDCDTITKRMKMFSEVAPDRELFIFYANGQRYPFTAQQIYRLAGKLASQLHHRGFSRQDVIANTLPNSPERLISDLGIMMAGCTLMNSQSLLADGEDFFQSANVARCSAAIVWQDELSQPWKLIKDYVTGSGSGLFTGVTCDRAPDLKQAILVTRRNSSSETRRTFLEELEQSDLEVYLNPDQKPEDTAVVQTTSGSTGYSKLVPRSHKEVITFGTSTQVPPAADSEIVNFRDNRIYNDKPMGWIGGFPFSTYCSGDKRVIHDAMASNGQVMDAGDVWNIVCHERCTMATFSMLEVNQIISYLDQTTTANEYKLPMLICAGQPIKKSQFEAAFRIAKNLLPSYGSTELGYVTMDFISDPKSDKLSDFYSGKVLPNVQVKILNDKGDDCKPREVGTLFVKGLNVFKGYFNRRDKKDEATEKAFAADGWFKAEDNGYWDAEGSLYVFGRRHDIITHGSYLLYPGWLEQRINSNPDVIETFIVPVSDPVLFHMICACVVPVSGSDLTEEKLREFCDSLFSTSRDSLLTPTPEFFMILKEFPQTSTGKPDRKLIRVLAEERFGAK